jgi:hypothetical protein
MSIDGTPSAVNPLNTAPPQRLSRRATVSEGLSPSTVSLVGGSGVIPTARYLSTPPQSSLSPSRPHQMEAEGCISHTSSSGQDQLLLSFYSNQRRGPHLAPPATFMTTVVDGGRRGCVASQQASTGNNANSASPLAAGGEGPGSNPVTLVVSTNSANNSIIAVRPPMSPVTAYTSDINGPLAPAGASLVGREEGLVSRRRGGVSPSASCNIGGGSGGGLAAAVDGSSDVVLSTPQLPRSTSVSPVPCHVAHRRRSDSHRETSTSPPVDSAAADESDAVAAASAFRAHQRTASLSQVVEGGNKSPATGPKRVHFNLQDPASDQILLTSSIRLSGDSGDEGRGSHSLPPRSIQPTFLNTTPLLGEVASTSPESSARPAEGSGAFNGSGSGSGSSSGGNASVATLTKLSGSPLLGAATPTTTVPTAPTLSLRLNLKDGRIEAFPTTAAASAASASASRSFSASSAALGDTFVGATYKPQMPLPKPALKPYSRYNGDSVSGSGADRTALNDGRNTGAIAGTSKAARAALLSLQRTLSGLQQRRITVTGKPGERLAQPSLVAQPRSASSETLVKWTLLALAALLSFGLILLATCTD